MDRKGQSYMIKRKNDSSIYRRHPDNLKIFKVQFEPTNSTAPQRTQDNCVALRDLVPFVQLKKREKHP